MNMRDYPTLHLGTNASKGTVCSKKEYPLLAFVPKCNVG
jgi:hypothetical protein